MLFFLKSFIYLFLEIGEEREKEREKKICVKAKHHLVSSWTCPNQGPGPQPRHVPWPGIEPATFHFVGWHSTNWAALVRADHAILLTDLKGEIKMDKFWPLMLVDGLVLELDGEKKEKSFQMRLLGKYSSPKCSFCEVSLVASNRKQLKLLPNLYRNWGTWLGT